MKLHFKKLLSLTLVLLLAMPLCACSLFGPDNSAYIGSWICHTVYVDGAPIPGSPLFSEGLRLELREDGTCGVYSAEITQEGKWSLALEDDREVITVQAGLLSASGTMEGSDIVLKDVMKPGIHFAFTAYTGSVPGAAVEEPPAEAPAFTEEDTEFWNADWYGYIYLHDTAGRYSGWANRYIPVCMRTELVESDLCRVVMWTDLPGADTEFFFNIAQNAHAGVLAYDAGGLFLGNVVPNISWNFDFEQYSNCNAMVLHDAWADETDHTNDYAFTLAVCRWGTDPALWEELAAMGEIDSLPPHFDDWYLPRVAAGEPMPEGPLHFDDSPEGDSEAPVEDIAAADKVEYRYCAYVDGKLVFTRDNISVFASDHDVFVQGGHAPTGINFLGDISESFFNDRFVYDPSATFAVLAGDESYLQDVPYEEFIAYVQEYSAAYGHNYMPVRLWIRENLVVYRIEEVYAADK